MCTECEFGLKMSSTESELGLKMCAECELGMKIMCTECELGLKKKVY